MQQQDEVGGSAIRYADVRYATDGISVIGLPNHSPLLGNGSEHGPLTGTFRDVANIGNIASTDRASSSLSGLLQNGIDVDLYRFSVARENVLGGGTIGVSLDVDYADGFGRPDTTLWVYRYDFADEAANDREFQLVYVGTDSDISDDQARPGQNLGDVDDFTRGSGGTADPFIGAREFAPGDYIVAVSTTSQTAESMRQFTHPNVDPAANPFQSAGFRLLPIAERVLSNSNFAGANEFTAVPWNIADQTAFTLTNSGTTLEFTNAFTGASEVTVGGPFPEALQDFALAPDGRLVGFATGNNDAASAYYTLDARGNGTSTSVGNANFSTFDTQVTGADANGNIFGVVAQDVGVQVNGLTFHGDGANLFGVGLRPAFAALGFIDANGVVRSSVPVPESNFVYRFNAANGNVINHGGVADRAGTARVDGAGTAEVEFFELNSLGTVTGLTAIGDTLFAVSSAGEFFRMNIDPSGDTRVSGANVNPTVSEIGALGVNFTGLGHGTNNMFQGGQDLSDVLFGVTADGEIFAFNTDGDLENVFPNGDFRVQSAGLGANGVLDLEFSPLDNNLWHTSNKRSDLDAGSFHFGFEGDVNDPGTWDPSVQTTYANTYDFPGGAKGAIESGRVDLSDYAATDLPTLYFSYYLNTENTNGANMNDSFRVFAAGDDGNWVQLATNNVASSTIQDFHLANEREVPGGNRSAQLYDVGDNAVPGIIAGAPDAMRQARLQSSLARFAGQEDVRFRFEFATAGGFRSGEANFEGEELTAIDGWKFEVGNIDARQFTVSQTDQTAATVPNQNFELDFGLVLDIPSGASIAEGSVLFVDSTPFRYTAIPIGATDIGFDADMTPAEVAANTATAIGNVLGVQVTTNPARENMLNVDVPVGGFNFTSLPASTIVDLPGVAAGHTAINITQADTAVEVRDAIRAELAQTFNIAGQETNLDVWPVHNETIRLYKYNVSFPAGAPNTGKLRLVNNNRQGDNFRTEVNRAIDNDFEGVYIDNVVVGLAERGERTLGSPIVSGAQATTLDDLFATTGFSSNPGRYQLEIRTSFSDPQGLVLTDSNDRHAPAIGFEVPEGAAGIADGETFTLTDGANVVTFEFDVVPDAADVAAGVTQGNIPIEIRPSDLAEDIAKAIGNAVNSPTVQGLLGVSANVISNSRIVEFHGPAAFSLDGSTLSGIAGLNTQIWGAYDSRDSSPGEEFGDVNRRRDQGVVFIESTFVRDSSNWGINVDGTRLSVPDQGQSSTAGRPTVPGSPIHFPADNPDNLAPGVVLINNVLDANVVGGIRISGVQAEPNADGDVSLPSPVARAVNNTIYGAGGGTGILVDDNAAPFVLNNILAENATGIQANGGVSQSLTTLSSNYFFGNNTNYVGIGKGSFDDDDVSNTDPFIDSAGSNFYLAAGSDAIDSSLNSLEEAASLNSLKSAIGLPPSPTLAPDRDVAGQRRVDDPAVSAPAGLGSNVFKDRGAYDRADFIGLQAILQQPLDNDSENVDVDEGVTFVRLTEGALKFFEVLLVDPFGGSGPDNNTVIGDSIGIDNVILTENGERLLPGDDYIFGYNQSSRTIRFTPLSGLWRDDSVYEITLINRDGTRYDAPAGLAIPDGETLTVTVGGVAQVFEWDSNGTVTTGTPIPYQQTFDSATMAAVLIQTLTDNGIDAYRQGDSAVMIPGGTIQDAAANPVGSLVPAIRDVAGNQLQANRPSTLTQFTLVMPEVKLDFGDGPNPLAVTQANDGARHAILPIDVAPLALGNFADGDANGIPSQSSADDLETSVLTASTTIPNLSFGNTGQGILTMPAPTAGLDGQIVSITSGLVTLDFEFDNDLASGPNTVAVDFSASATADDVAAALADAVNQQLFNGTIADVAATTTGATVDLGVAPHVTVDVSNAPDLTQSFIGNLEVIFGGGPFVDGQALELVDGENRTTRFELNDTSAPGPFLRPSLNLAVIDLDLTTATTEDVVQAISDAINTRIAAGAIALGPSTANGTSLFINGDDEEGVTFGGLLNPRALPAPVTVMVTGAGVLDAWVDFSGDGQFTPDERIATNMPVLPGANTFMVTTPLTAQTGFTTSRFRLSKTGNVTETGLAIGGEVEDYLIEIVDGFPPEAADDSYRTNEDTTLVVAPADGILANDMDQDSSFQVRDEDPLTAGVQPFKDVTRGTLTLQTDGSFTYVPEADFYGTDTFVYFAQDARLTSGTPATVTISVSEVNDQPTAIDDTIAIWEDQSIVVSGDFFTENDFRGVLGTNSQTNELPQSLIITSASIAGPASLVGGTVSVTNNELTFTPPAHYSSQIDGPILVNVTIQDDGQTYNTTTDQLEDDFLTDVGTLTITVNELNDSPEYTLTSNLAILEDAGPQSVPGFISGILPGPASATDEAMGPANNQENQTVSFTATALDPGLFASGPSIDAAGNLTYELAANVNNQPPYPPEILVEVLASDSGAAETIFTNLFDPNAIDSLNSYDGFTVAVADNNGNTVVFEFEDAALPGVGMTGGVPHAPITFDGTDTAQSVLATLLAAVNNPPAGSIDPGTSAWGVTAFADSVTGEIRLVGDSAVSTSAASPSVVLRNLATALGAGQSYDGSTFVVVDSSGDSITFELNDTTDTAPATPGVTAGNSAVDYDPSFTPEQLTQAISDAINNPDPAVLLGLAGTWEATSSLPAGGDTMQLSGAQSASVSLSTPTQLNPLETFVVAKAEPIAYRPANNANVQTFTITVEAINDAPEFDLINPIQLLEDAGPQNIVDFLTNAAPGPGSALDESSQTLTLTIQAVDPTAFASGPTAVFDSVSGTADLMFELNPDINNETLKDLSIVVTLMDDGGTAFGGQDTTVQTLTLDVTPVNDAPSFGLDQTELTYLEDAEQESGNTPTRYVGFATDPKQGPDTAVDETSVPATMQTLNFVTISVSDPSLFASGPTITPAGDLEFVTAADQNGTAIVVVRLLDSGPDGSTGNGDDNQARPDQTFTINLTAVNDAPSFDIPTTTSSIEDQGLVQVANFATNLLPGPPTATDEVGQQFIVTAVAAEPANFVVQPEIAADGTLVYQTGPDVNSLNANLEVVVTVSDNGPSSPAPNQNSSPPKTFTIVAAPINDAPSFTLSQNEVTVNEDVEQEMGTTITSFPGVTTDLVPGPATATDEATQNLAFSVVSVSAPELFEIQPAIDSAGELTFKTAAHKNGTALVVMRLLDDGASTPPPNDNDSVLQTLTINITPVNDAPEFAIPSSTTVNEDAGLVSISGFATDVRRGPVGTDDENSQQVTFAVAATDPSSFTVQPTISPDGTLVFQTAENVNNNNANLEVKVVLTDNGFDSPPPNVNTSIEQTFNISVIPVNDSPITQPFTVSTTEDQPVQIIAADVIANDVPGPADESGQSLRMTQIERTSSAGGLISPVFSGGEIVSFTYTPPTNVVLQDSFLYVVSDDGTPSMSGSGTIFINITGVNDPPQFDKGPDQVIPEDGGAISVPNWARNILAGPPAATDEHNTQNVTFSVATNNAALFAVQPSVSSDGTLTFTGAPDANGVAVVTATPMDDGSDVAPNNNTGITQTFTVTISPVNDEPTFTAGADVSVAEDSGAYAQPWATNIAPASGLLDNPQTATDEAVQGVDFVVTNDSPSLFAVQPVLTSSGNLQFTPSSDQFGTAVVTITAVDTGVAGNLDDNTSDAQTLTITVTPVNDRPVAVEDNYSTTENELLAVPAPGLVANDTDVDNDPLSAVANTLQSSLGASVVINSDGSFTYDPSSVLSIQQMSEGQSVLDSFTYEVQDPAGATSINAVIINVTGIDDPPVAVDDAYSLGVSQTRLLDVLLNDEDIDSAIDPRTIMITRLPLNGTATVNQTGVIEYQASPGFVGTDTLAYTVEDSAGNLSNEATVQITINNPPVAVDDSAFTFKDVPISINVIGNDSDLDGSIQSDSIQIVATPGSGTAEPQADGTVLYTPAPGFFGEDTFSYIVADNVGTQSNVADVMIRVLRSRWQNPDNRLDVSGDGFVSPIDALLVIDYLNSGANTFLPETGIDPAPYYDVNGDEFVTAIDALLVIDFLNTRSNGGAGEGEAFDWSQQYVLPVTPLQVLETVGQQVMEEVQEILGDSRDEAMQEADQLVYGPLLPNALDEESESDELVEFLASSDELDEDSVSRALDDFFGDTYGPRQA